MSKIKNLINKIFRTKEEKRDIKQIDYDELEKIIRNSNDYILIDVRNPNEYGEGHLPGAINIPNYEIENKIYGKVPNKEKLILLYCRSGGRSLQVQEILKEKGYKNVYSLKNGIEGI